MFFWLFSFFDWESIPVASHFYDSQSVASRGTHARSGNWESGGGERVGLPAFRKIKAAELCFVSLYQASASE